MVILRKVLETRLIVTFIAVVATGEKGVAREVVKVEEIQDIMRYGIMSTQGS